MVTIDTHHHFWDFATPEELPTGERTSAVHRAATPEQLRPLLDRNGVASTVLVQSANTVEHTRDLLHIAAEQDFVAGVCGWVPLHEPAAANDALMRLGAPRALKGVRHLAHHASTRTPEPEGPARLEALQVAAEHDLVYEVVCVDAAALRSAAELASRVPELTVVVDHLGRPPVENAGWEPWASALAEVAGQGNTVIKVSAGIHLLTSWNLWDPDALAPYVEHARALFGAQRMMLASNWPVTRLVTDYDDVIAGTRRLLAEWPEAERSAALGRTALRVYAIAASEVRSL